MLTNTRDNDLAEYRDNVADYGVAVARVIRDRGEYAGGLYYQHGATITTAAAERIARRHSTTVAELIEQGLKVTRAGAMKTTDLTDILGY
jgi:hypothetical protein